MTPMLPFPLLLLVLFSEFSQVCCLSIPTSLSHFRCSQLSNMCTTNITIPTPTAECILPCASIQKAQIICRDNTICMCRNAPSSDLESCLNCIVQGIGSFANSVSQYVDSMHYQISNYNASCARDASNQATIPHDSTNLQSQCAEDSAYEISSVSVPSNALYPFSSRLFPLFSFLVAFTLLPLVYHKRNGLLKTLE